jgi:hypothetical protein
MEEDFPNLLYPGMTRRMTTSDSPTSRVTRPSASTTRPATSPTVVGKIIKEKKYEENKKKKIYKKVKKSEKGHLK